MKLLILLCISGLSFGCASTSINKEEIAKIRRVAVVGFTMDYNLDLKGGLKSVLMGRERKMGMTKVDHHSGEKPISKHSYDYVIHKLKDTGWQVLSS